MNKIVKKLMVGTLVFTIAGGCALSGVELSKMSAQTEAYAKTTKKDITKDKTAKNNTAKDKTTKKNNKNKKSSAAYALNKMKKILKKTYTCDMKYNTRDAISYFGLAKNKIDSIAYEGKKNSSINMDIAVVVKAKKGYEATTRNKLKVALKQTTDYAKMYDMDLYRVQQARLYQSGSYIGLFIVGKTGNSDNAQKETKIAKQNSAKVDKAWKSVFGGSAKNYA